MFIKKLYRLQAQWAQEISVLDSSEVSNFFLTPILALDIQYMGEAAYLGGAVLLPTGKILKYVGKSEAGLTYIPGLFCFREGPPLYAFVKQILAESASSAPQLLIIDGHGIAHPQGLGLASWLGLRLNMPSIGCAKGNLLPYQGDNLGQERGSTIAVYQAGKQVGEVLRTQKGVKPLFVSPGHLISHEASHQIILGLAGAYRIPDLLREADQLARAAAQEKVPPNAIDLGYFESRY